MQGIKKEGSEGFAVINTLSWPRDGVVTLPARQSTIGDKVVDEQMNEVLSQRLSTGELAFEAKNIPALGSKFYKILPGKAKNGPKMVDKNTLKNDLISVTVDQKTGNVKNFIALKSGWQFVDSASLFGLNSYNYLAGVRNGSTTSPVGEITNATNISIKIKENGPLIASLVVNSDAESCKWLTREVKLTKHAPYLELVNTIDKIATRKKEGIHYGFAFNVPNGEIRMDIPLGIMIPETNQIPYSNKNWFTFQRWIDISNAHYGVTWTSVEAPIVEIGNITGTILDGARLGYEWIKTVPKSQTLISWPLNNHWNTNFPLEQGGPIVTTYAILPHTGAYNPVVANRFGVAQHRPLIVVETNHNPIKKPLFLIDNPKVMLSTMKKSEDNKALIVRLRSVSAQIEQLRFTWTSRLPSGVYHCASNEMPLAKQEEVITMLPYGTSSFRIDFNQ